MMKDDKVLHGVFYGHIKGFNKSRELALVDFGSDTSPDLVFFVKVEELQVVHTVERVIE